MLPLAASSSLLDESESLLLLRAAFLERSGERDLSRCCLCCLRLPRAAAGEELREREDLRRRRRLPASLLRDRDRRRRRCDPLLRLLKQRKLSLGQ